MACVDSNFQGRGDMALGDMALYYISVRALAYTIHNISI